MYIEALNCGSSSLKYQIFDAETKKPVVSGNVEKIGAQDSFVTQKYPDGTKEKQKIFIPNHDVALIVVLNNLLKNASINLNDIAGVGHRVVMGGEDFKCSVKIDDQVTNTIEKLSALAPLHNPPALQSIKKAKTMLPNATHVAVFDTAFHQTMPDYAYSYAVPYNWREQMGVRRYGFHGTSHLYASKVAANMLNKPAEQCNVITLHLGSGASAAAVKGGVSIDTTMGMTPLSGFPMMTRAGEIDAGAVMHVMKQTNMTAEQMENALSKQCGIKGMTGYADCRDVENNVKTDDNCRLSLDMLAYSVQKQIGSYAAILGRTDAIVFTAGIGENSPYMRALICESLGHMGIKLDKSANEKALGFKGTGNVVISTPDSKIKVFMIPANEELVIVEDTLAIMNCTYNPNHLKMAYSFANIKQR